MKFWKTLGNISLILLACFAVVVDCFFIYYKYINKDITIGTNYVSTIDTADLISAEDLTEEERDEYEQRYFMVANYYDNKKENGTALQELQFNYASDYQLTSSYATGMQFLGKYEHEVIMGNSSKAGQYISPDFYYYDSFDRINWKATSELNRNQVMIISIDGEPYSIQLTGEIKEYFEIFGWKVFKTYHYWYIYPNLFEAVMDAIESNSAEYGDWYFKMDLSKYFSIKKLDKSNGKFIEEATDIIKNYVVVKVHFEDNGAVASSQSLFKTIEYNPGYDLNEDYDTTYWQERVVYNLTAKNLVYRYSSTYNGYFASLNLSAKNMFATIPRAKINIVLDLQSIYLIDNEINLVGFDYNAFENLELDTLQITGNTQTFYLLEKCLYNTSLKTLKHSSGITLDFGVNATNNTVEVILI